MRPRKVPLGGAPRGAASKIPAGLQDKGIEAVVVTTEAATDKIRERAPSCCVRLYVQMWGWEAEPVARDTRRMVDDNARELAIYYALKAVDEVAAALQAHLVEEHRADLERAAAQSTSTNSFKLLRQARERLGEGLRAIEADTIAGSDDISLRNERPTISLRDEQPTRATDI